MKTITVGQRRQNPTDVLNSVESGETFAVTRYNREIARIVPSQHPLTLIPAKTKRGTRLASLPRHELRSADSIDKLLADERHR